MRLWLLLVLLLASPARADDSITLVGLDGGVVELRPAQGQVLVLHFWATWCPTCVEEFRHLQNAFATCSEDRVRLLLVNVGEEDAAIRDFVEQHDVGLPVLRDPKGSVWRGVDGRGLPLNLFWSSEGTRTDLGPKTEKQWRKLFASEGCGSARPSE